MIDFEHDFNANQLKDAPYYRMWQDRYRPFLDDNWILYMEFSQQYFEKLKRELESAGHEVTADRGFDCWYSEPVGYFGVSNLLKGESFVFFDVNHSHLALRSTSNAKSTWPYSI